MLPSLPNVDEAAELSIKMQLEQEKKKGGMSFGIAYAGKSITDEDTAMLELANENAEEIYREKGK